MEVAQHYYATLAQLEGLKTDDAEDLFMQDFDVIGSMLIPLGHRDNNPVDGHGGPGWFYTCRHYQDGDCSIYDKRPRMCKNYPYDYPCQYKACSRIVEEAHGQAAEAVP